MDTISLAPIAALLPPWYQKNARPLPWRASPAPYRVWLSEIMLQQTRVEAVLGYYDRFLAALPTVEALAAADDELLMKLWEGLGYYSRARNLKKTAQIVANDFGGAFPDTYEGLLALPGIGPYTAGAIASICFDRPTPAVDGNVLRVFARYTEYPGSVDTEAAKKDAADALRPLYTPGLCGTLTQGMMELGACVCTPNGAPKCNLCPLAAHCAAHANGTWERYPVRTEKKARKTAELTAVLLRCGERFALRKRPGKGLLAGLWEFPNTPLARTKNAADEAAAFAALLGAKPTGLLREINYTHVFTHVEWRVHGFYFTCAETPASLTWATAKELKSVYALPSAFRPLAEIAEMAETADDLE